MQARRIIKCLGCTLQNLREKRILKSRHLSAIIRLPALTKSTPDGLVKLVNEMQQHISILKSLGVQLGPEIEHQLLEEKLPRELVDKWEEKMSSNYDEFPTLSDLCDFLTDTAFRLSKRDKEDTTCRQIDFKSKRHYFGKEHSNKRFRKIEGSARTLVTYHPDHCVICKNTTHPLYKCQTFQK